MDGTQYIICCPKLTINKIKHNKDSKKARTVDCIDVIMNCFSPEITDNFGHKKLLNLCRFFFLFHNFLSANTEFALSLRNFQIHPC